MLFRLLIWLLLLLSLVVRVILSVPIDKLLLNPNVPHVEGNALLSAPFEKFFGREGELKFKIKFLVPHFDGQECQFEVFFLWRGGRVNATLRCRFCLTLILGIFFLIVVEFSVNP